MQAADPGATHQSAAGTISQHPSPTRVTMSGGSYGSGGSWGAAAAGAFVGRLGAALPLAPYDQQPNCGAAADDWHQFQQAVISYNLDPNLLALRAASAATRGCSPGCCDLHLMQQQQHHHHQHQHHYHRRRMATREATGVLRTWLSEHRMNPYPTKGEKIMLAVITAMTLTQVSTWFANARRRLKKENKMTWAPRTRPDEEDEEEEEEEEGQDEADDEMEVTAEVTEEVDGAPSAEAADRKRRRPAADDDAEPSAKMAPVVDRDQEAPATSPPADRKPRIWSLVDTATRAEPPRPPPQQPPPLPHPTAFAAFVPSTLSSSSSTSSSAFCRLPVSVPGYQHLQQPHQHQHHRLPPPPPLMRLGASALYGLGNAAPSFLEMPATQPQLPRFEPLLHRLTAFQHPLMQ